jgi:sRNA-binding protein
MSHDDLTEKLIERLALVYPRTFFAEQSARRPLAIGIHHALRADAAHGLTDAELRTVLHRYCTSPGYLASMIDGTDRIGLDGLAAGSVSAEAVAAAVKLARLSQKSREQREAKVEKAVAVAVAPERQPEKAATNVVPMRQYKNDNAVKRLSLADLRTAARQRQATGHHQDRS